MRAAAPAAPGRARARPLRGAVLARAPSPRAPVPARPRLPAAPAARGGKEPGRPSPDRRPRRACPPSADGSWRRSPACSCAARIVGSASSTTSGSEGGSVVLGNVKILFRWATDGGKLPFNPAEGLRLGGVKPKAGERRLPFGDEEARLILEKARGLGGADRWIPW